MRHVLLVASGLSCFASFGCLVVDLPGGPVSTSIPIPEIHAGVYAVEQDSHSRREYFLVQEGQNGELLVSEHQTSRGVFSQVASLHPVVRTPAGETLVLARLYDSDAKQFGSKGIVLFLRTVTQGVDVAQSVPDKADADRHASRDLLGIPGLTITFEDRIATIAGAQTPETLARIAASEWVKRISARTSLRVLIPALCRFTPRTEEQRRADAEEVLRVNKDIRAGKPEPAVPVLQRLVSTTCDVRAAFLLGELYGRGRGLPKDPTRARDHFMIAAARGNYAVHRELGTVFSTDTYGLRDDELARSFFTAGVRTGDAEAQYRLGNFQAAQTGGTADQQSSRTAEAVGWWEKASAQGHALASLALARAYLKADNSADRALPLLKKALDGNPSDEVRQAARVVHDEIAKHLDAAIAASDARLSAEEARLKREIAEMEARAWRLPPPDSRLVFVDGSGRLVDQKGTVLPPAMAATAMHPAQHALDVGLAEITARSSPSLYQKKQAVQIGAGPGYRGVYQTSLAQPLADLLLGVAERSEALKVALQSAADELRGCADRGKARNVSNPQFVCLQARGADALKEWRCSEKVGDAAFLRCFFESNVLVYAAAQRLGWDPASTLARLEALRKEKGQTGLMFVMQSSR